MKDIDRKQKIFLIFILLIILSGWFARWIGVEPSPYLNGISNSAEKPVLSLQGLFNGLTAMSAETWMKENIPFRAIYIKIRNQIYWSVFKKSSNPNVVIGKNYVLYEPWYLQEYLGFTRIDNNYDAVLKNMEQIVSDLKFIQDKLDEAGKISYVFYTPSKASFTESFFPDAFLKNAPITERERFCNVLLQLFDQYGIRYFDSVKFFRENSLNVTLFPRSGTHYTWAAGITASLAMIDEINEISPIKFRKVKPVFSQIKMPIHPDRDIFNVLNLVDLFSWGEYENDRYYDIDLINLENTQKAPRVFIQGGSFQGPLRYLFQNSNTVNRYSYAENKIVSDCDGERIVDRIEDISVEGNLDNDIFIFEVNQFAADNMSFGFISQMKTYLKKNGIPPVQEVNSSESEFSGSFQIKGEKTPHFSKYNAR